MKNHCRFIAIAGVVCCIIGTLYYTWQVAKIDDSFMLITLVIGCIITYLVYIPWSAFAEILERLENLEWQLSNTKTDIKQEAASVAEITNKIEPIFRDEYAIRGITQRVAAPDYWICSCCGVRNPGYVGTCKCGADRLGNMPSKRNQAETIEEIQIKPQPQTELQPQLKQDSEPKLQEVQETEQELQSKPEVQLHTEEPQPELESQSQPESQSEPKSDREIEIESAGSQPQPESESQPLQKPEPNQERQFESKQELPPYPEPQPEPKIRPLFCISCGSRLEADSNFCIYCGAKIIE